LLDLGLAGATGMSAAANKGDNIVGGMWPQKGVKIDEEDRISYNCRQLWCANLVGGLC